MEERAVGEQNRVVFRPVIVGASEAKGVMTVVGGCLDLDLELELDVEDKVK